MRVIFNYFKEFIDMIPTIGFWDLIDIFLVALLLYKLITMIRTTSTERIAKAILFLLLATWLTGVLDMHALNFIFDRILELGAIALVIMFQPELRRALERLGSKSLREIWEGRAGDMAGISRVISQTVIACESMSKERIGALIVFERRSPVAEYFKTGTVLDAKVTEQIIRAIFFPKAALHDGAMMIQGERIAAAGCVLPLSENVNLNSDLGTRHRAGVGMSEVSDAVVVIVSEETGTISVAVGGMLKRHLAPQTLERLLNNELAPTEQAKPASRLANLKKRVFGKGKRDEKK